MALLQDGLLKCAPSPTMAIRNGLQLLVNGKCRVSIAKGARRTEERLLHMVGSTSENNRHFVFEVHVRAKGTTVRLNLEMHKEYF